MAHINKKYKDRLFRLLFGTAEMKDNILSLYNALNNTEYSDPNELELRTIDDAVYLSMKNDVSFLIDSYLLLWEQQSTFNPNMPVRGLMYFGKLYNSYITENSCNIYGSKLVKMPTPQYIVFYNGKIEKESITKLRLSDSFVHKAKEGEFEWTATMYNLNRGKNNELLSRCKPLSDYMTLVNCINDYMQEYNDINIAVDKAVVRCIEENILKDFLIKHRAEVLDVVITEFDEEVFANGMKEEGREEGREEGQEDLFKAVELLHAGATGEELKNQGLDDKTIIRAEQIKNTFF